MSLASLARVSPILVDSESSIPNGTRAVQLMPLGPTSTTDMPLQSLNEDALVSIVSYLDASDARQLSLTAHGAVHVVAKHQALTSVAVHSIANTTRFCIYILTDMPHRLPALHALEVDTRWIMDGPVTEEERLAVASLLANVLERANNLRRLALTGTEAWILDNRRITDAVSSMRFLSEISFEGLGRCTLNMIRDLLSAPSKICLAEVWVRPDGESALDLRVRHDFTLPSVTQLVLKGHISDLIPAPIYTRTFPNVRYADLGSSSKRWDTDVVTLNWPCLQHVKGTAEALSSWVNAVPVHLMEVTTPLWHSRPSGNCSDNSWIHAQQRSNASEAIANAQPIAIVVSVSSRLGVDFVKASSRLRYLCVSLHDIRNTADWGTQLYGWWVSTDETQRHAGGAHDVDQEGVSPVFADTGIICLQVRCDPRPGESIWDPTVGCSSAAPSCVETFGAIITAVPTLAKSVASLRYLGLHVPEKSPLLPTATHPSPQLREESKEPEDDHQRALTYWWRLRGAGDDRVAEPLDVAVGERIAAYMSSPSYDYTKDFDGELPLAHNGISLLIFDALLETNFEM